MLLNKISDYEIKELITQHNTTKLYHAIHVYSAREIALKLKPVKFNEINDSIAKRLLAEARVSANLKHPNIANVYEVGRHNDLFYIAMEYSPLGSLRIKLDQNERLSATWAIDITLQLLSALEYAHNRGYIHRDIKPENILFRTSDHVVLADFGIARRKYNSTSINQPNGFVNLTHYLAPEQIRDNHADRRSDLYSLGVILYELIIGKFTYDDSKDYQENFRTIQNSLSEIKDDLLIFRPVFNKLLAENPDDRFQTAESLINKLQVLKNTLTNNKIYFHEAISPKKKPIKKYKLTFVASFFFILLIPAFAIQQNNVLTIEDSNTNNSKTTTIYKERLNKKNALNKTISDTKVNTVTTVPAIASSPEARPSNKQNSAADMHCILKLDGCNNEKTKAVDQPPITSATPALLTKESDEEKSRRAVKKADISCILKLETCTE